MSMRKVTSSVLGQFRGSRPAERDVRLVSAFADKHAPSFSPKPCTECCMQFNIEALLQTIMQSKCEQYISVEQIACLHYRVSVHPTIVTPVTPKIMQVS